MVQAADLPYSYSLEPSSSQFPRDEEAVERAFWQSTPTAMEELRQGTEGECHQAASKDQDRPNDPLSLSTQETRLIRQTWASAARSIGRSSDGEAQTSSRFKYRNKQSGAARPDSTNITSPSTVISSIDESTFFRHLKNIEKVCKTVDERMQKRKVQKEWSIKVISETARLRDEEGRLKVNVNTKTKVDDNDPFDLLRLGTPVQSADREPEAMEEEVVPTSQSQERYLSPLGASSCAPINGSTAT